MKKRLLVLCEAEKSYVYNFLEFYKREKNREFEIKAFTSSEELIGHAWEQEISILLINEEMLCPEIEQICTGQIILLTEENRSEPYIAETKDALASVKKYQSAEELLKMILYSYSDKKDEKLQIFEKKNTRMIGVYSVCGRSLKTLFSITAGMVLAEKQKTLYINMEGYSGFREFFQTDYSRDLSDILFRVCEGKKNSMLKLSETVRRMGNLYYIPPVLSPMDFAEMRFDDWESFIKGLVEYTDYENIIFDFGENISHILYLLGECHIIFMPDIKDSIAHAKMVQFEKSLYLLNKENLREKINMINFPEFPCLKNPPHHAEDILNTAFGEYVRAVAAEYL